MIINSQFDGGNIKCINCEDPSNIQLRIKKDFQSDFYQWFYFRVSGAKGIDCYFNIDNASGAAFSEGWHGYHAVASYDRENWFRIPTSYDGKCLNFIHQPKCESVYYAYFAPYSMERHYDLIARAQREERVTILTLGETLDQQPLDVLKISSSLDDRGKKVCWVIGRQHPGETMAEWWMEGFLDRLLDERDPIARMVLSKAVFYVVPNMNPDGSRRGHLRTNAAGINLNRVWDDPCLDRSPEVFHVRQKMHDTRVDFCLDVHGDEVLPYNFIAGSEAIPSWNENKEELLNQFRKALMQVSPDFQQEFGYEPDRFGAANMGLCMNYVAHTFNCLAMTLEMPFKDADNSPLPQEGWSPKRSQKLGADTLSAIHSVLDELDLYKS